MSFEGAIAEYYETEYLTVDELISEIVEQDLPKDEIIKEVHGLLKFLSEKYD